LRFTLDKLVPAKKKIEFYINLSASWSKKPELVFLSYRLHLENIGQDPKRLGDMYKISKIIACCLSIVAVKLWNIYNENDQRYGQCHQEITGEPMHHSGTLN
jgi:hypothetical protein